MGLTSPTPLPTYLKEASGPHDAVEEWCAQAHQQRRLGGLVVEQLEGVGLPRHQERKIPPCISDCWRGNDGLPTGDSQGATSRVPPLSQHGRSLTPSLSCLVLTSSW